MNNIEEIKKKVTLGVSRLKLQNKIRTIILYGSFARNTDTSSSDVDILIVSSGNIEKNQLKLQKMLEEIFENKHIDLAIYTPNKFEILLENGSLFMHHVKLEGQVIYGKDKYSSKEYLFGKLTGFKGITEDELLYKRMLEKTISSISTNSANYFDLNYLALLARNSMIILCYHNNQPTFGKLEVYEKCMVIFGKEFPLQLDVYEELLKYRIYYRRGCNKVELPSISRYSIYTQQMTDLISFSLNRLDLDNSIDRVFFLLKNGAGRNLYTSYEIFTDFDRDIYFGLNKYLLKNYSEKIDSISDVFLPHLLEKYKIDKVILNFVQVLEGMSNIREKSSTYSIDTPDIYSDVKVDDKLYLEKIISFFSENEYIKRMRQNSQWFNSAILYILNFLDEKYEFEKLKNFMYKIDTIRKVIRALGD